MSILPRTASPKEDETTSIVLPGASAVSPTVTLTDITSITEEETASITASLSIGIYDTIEYDWSIQAGGGTLDRTTGPTVVYTPADILVNTEVIVRQTITVRGTGTNAKDGTSDSTSADEIFVVLPLPLPDVTAPVLFLTEYASITDRQVARIVAVVLGGTYDTIEYDWSVQSGGGSYDASVDDFRTCDESFAACEAATGLRIYEAAAGTAIVYHPADVSADTSATIRCEVTVRGTGTYAGDGTEDTVLVDETFTVAPASTPPADLPDVTAPAALLLPGYTSITDRQVAKITATPSGGTYDSIAYTWVILMGGGSLDVYDRSTVVYTPDDVLMNISAAVMCTATVRGGGTNAKDGTEDDVVASEMFTVMPAGTPPVTLPDTTAPVLFLIDYTSITDRQVARIVAVVLDGVYDTIEYAWSVRSGGGTLDRTDRDVAVYYPIPADTSATIRCEVTVRGTGVHAGDGTEDTVLVDETFTVVTSDAIAPALTLTDITSITKGQTADISAVASGGIYDTIEYTWTIVSGGGSLSAQ